MATIEMLEGLLAEAAQCLGDAAGELRELPQLQLSRNLRRIGTAVNAVWEFREGIHTLRPDLKPPFVSEHEADHERYDRLAERAEEAHRLEDTGAFEQAHAAFSALRLAAGRGYFCMVAEAGLFRLMQERMTNPSR